MELSAYHAFSVAFISLITYLYFWKWAEPALPPIVEGFFQPEFMDAAMALRHGIESGSEQGAAFAVYHDDVLVIDMWAGYADLEAQRRWRNQTTTLTFDCTKGALAILLAVLVDKGQLNYINPIADYWKDFGSNGKDSITLEDLLTHQAGLSYMTESISLRSLISDRSKVERQICDQAPVWTPGSRMGHHEVTLGLIVDFLMPKVDKGGRNTQDIFHEDIAEPFGIEYSMNNGQEKLSQTARLQYHSSWLSLWHRIKSPFIWMFDFSCRKVKGSEIYKASNVVKEYTMSRTVFNNPELRETTLSSFSGTGTARGLAKLFSFVANNGCHGDKVMLSEEAVLKLTTPLARGFCPILKTFMEYSLGLQVFKNPYGENVYGYAGYGGQMVYADPTNKLSIAYLTNHLNIFRSGEDPRFIGLQQAVYKNLHRYTERKERMFG